MYDPRFAQENPRMVRIRTLRLTYVLHNLTYTVSPAVCVRQFRWDSETVVSGAAEVYRDIPGPQGRGVVSGGRRGVPDSLLRGQRQEDLRH